MPMMKSPATRLGRCEVLEKASGRSKAFTTSAREAGALSMWPNQGCCCAIQAMNRKSRGWWMAVLTLR